MGVNSPPLFLFVINDPTAHSIDFFVIVYYTIHMGLKQIYEIIKKGIDEGQSYTELHALYPLMTKALYKKLSGRGKITRFNKTSESIRAIINDNESLSIDSGEPDRDILIGSLFGDGHIEQITKNEYTDTSLYRTAHCWAQIGYTKLLYEMFKPFSSALTLKHPASGFQDYNIHFTTITSPTFSKYRNMFYNDGIKDVMSLEIVSLLNWKSLSFWIMDDGKRRGGRYCFSLPIGFQPHYNECRLKKVSECLSDIFKMDFRYGIEGQAYLLYILSKDKKKVIENILPHIHPDFYYKFQCIPEECGEVYRGLSWYKNWQEIKVNLEHPFISEHSYKEYTNATDEIFKQKFFNALFVRTLVRGFPYSICSKEELIDKWNKIKDSVVTDTNGVLTCTPLVNSFPSFFMTHRFNCRKRGNRSPYDIFLNRKKLKKVLAIQLRSGPNILNTNIKNAISTYGSSGLGVFNTGIAQYLIREYCIGNEVLDPCAGWGNRLSATVSLGKNYQGIEPSTKTYIALMAMKKWFEEHNEKSTITILKGVAENSEYYKDSFFDLCITSPPYYNLEEYSYEDSQSCVGYTHFDSWVDKFLRVMINNVYNSLKIGACFILNVGDVGKINLTEVSKELCIEVGFSLEKTYSLRPFKKPGMEKTWQEPIFVFRKGDCHGEL